MVVAVLSRTGDGTAPPETLAAVEAVLLNDQVRPLTDWIIVQSADIQPFNILAQLWLYVGPDPDMILATALASLNIFLATAHRLGRDIPRSAINAALHVAGVQLVELAKPAADQVFTMGYLSGAAMTPTAIRFDLAAAHDPDPRWNNYLQTEDGEPLSAENGNFLEVG